MKKLFTFITSAMILCFSINSFAQVSSLFFTQSSGTYTEIMGGTVVATATATTGAGGLDDLNFSAQPIPFTFTFDGIGYTEFNINSNGYITFGATLPAAGSPYTPISNTAAYSGAISGIGRDLWGLFRTNAGARTIDSPVLTGVVDFSGIAVGQFITGTGIPGTTTVPTTTIVSFDVGAGTITMSANATSTTATAFAITMTSGEIRTETFGAIGNRIHVIQFKRFARFAGANEMLNFQIRLYETSNEIEIVYGTNFTLNATSAAPQVGLRGAANTDFNNRTGTDWANSTAGIVNTASMTLSSTSLPVSGQIYKWAAPPACVITISNLNPTGTIFPGCGTTYAPQVNISNNGTLGQTGISVNYSVGAYNETVTGLTLASGANMNVDFPNTLTYSSADAGVKNVTVTVNATCDGGPVAYVLNTSFTVSATNINVGGPFAGYYFANSTSGANCAPSQPTFAWEDTTGSVDLILNGVNMVGGLMVGSVDDGFFTLGDIMGSNVFRFDDANYDSLFIGTNGMIAFSRANNTQAQLTTFTPLAIPGTTAPRPAIFPFWKDFNYGDVDVPVNRLSYKVTSDKVIITYDRAPNFNTAVDPDDYVSFQVVLEIAPAPVINGRVLVNFDDATSGSSFLAKYNALTLAAHTVGLQNLSGTSALQYRRVVLATVTVAGPLFSSPLSLMFGPNESALPVDLIAFNANVDRNNVVLSWTTAWEENNARFDVQRRAANTEAQWTTVGTVAGNGTTFEQKNYSYTDKNLNSGSYEYRLVQFDYDGNSNADFNLSHTVEVGIPSTFALAQNYPNPFNPTTKIDFQIPVEGLVKLSVFDMSGREVATLVNEALTPGYYTYDFNGSNLSSGAYFFRLVTNNSVITKKMMLVK